MDLLIACLQRIVDHDDDQKTPRVDPVKLGRIGRVIYWVVKVRGWKAVGVSMFIYPSGISHLITDTHVQYLIFLPPSSFCPLS